MFLLRRRLGNPPYFSIIFLLWSRNSFVRQRCLLWPVLCTFPFVYSSSALLLLFFPDTHPYGLDGNVPSAWPPSSALERTYFIFFPMWTFAGSSQSNLDDRFDSSEKAVAVHVHLSLAVRGEGGIWSLTPGLLKLGQSNFIPFISAHLCDVMTFPGWENPALRNHVVTASVISPFAELSGRCPKCPESLAKHNKTKVI